MANETIKNMELRLEKLQTVIEIYGGIELLSNSEKKEYERLWVYIMAMHTKEEVK